MMKKICGAFTLVMILGLALVAGILLVPTLAGGQTMAVISGSMEPAIPVGSIVAVRPVEYQHLAVGDVITYERSGTKVTHRVHEIQAETKQLITKGDANDTTDGEPVSADQLVGKLWFHVPLLGYLSIYIRTPLGIVGACVILFLLILFQLLPEMVQFHMAGYSDESGSTCSRKSVYQIKK